jgi:hypothetical protein
MEITNNNDSLLEFVVDRKIDTIFYDAALVMVFIIGPVQERVSWRDAYYSS